MKTTPTVSIPVEGLVEVTNSHGDTICVNPKGQDSYTVQLVRGNRGRSRIAVLNSETSDLEELKVAVDRLLSGNYEGVTETEGGSGSPWYAMLLGLVGTLLMFGLGLTFLAYMISVFLEVE